MGGVGKDLGSGATESEEGEMARARVCCGVGVMVLVVGGGGSGGQVVAVHSSSQHKPVQSSSTVQ